MKELVKAASDHAQTIFHPVGTCKMGKGDEAVVNDKLQDSWNSKFKSCGCIYYAQYNLR
jgi:choline dehydrogenase-like flavoprotein